MSFLPRLYIGPMSKNVVDVVLEFGDKVGLIPSRRQVDYKSGYVNNWTTETFTDYVSGRCIIQRDHGGVAQGDQQDSGYESFEIDAKYFDLIHIDPWTLKDFEKAVNYTAEAIRFLYKLNPNISVEVGTEESIYPLSPEQLNDALNDLKSMLEPEEFDRIQYAVIQSGVGLDLPNKKNIGEFDMAKFQRMNDVCAQFGLLSKEHNGDYLKAPDIQERYRKGLGAINIAPEFGQMETIHYMKTFSEEDVEQFYRICLKLNRWQKWCPVGGKEPILLSSGHYALSDPRFIELKDKYSDIDEEIKETMRARIKGILEW